MMLTVLLVAAMGVIPVAAWPASNGAGEPGFSLMSVTPIVVGDDWYATPNVPPAFFWGAGEPVFSGSGPFQFECEYPVVVDVTDDFQKGDQFRIYDNGSPIGETSAVPVDNTGLQVGPEAAFADPTYSSGSFWLPAGAHSISIEVINNPYDGGRGYIRVMHVLSPPKVEAIVFPGQSIQIEKTVRTPVIAQMPDVYFLADTTGSMAPVIAAMQATADTIISTISGLDPTAQFGAGWYKDFPYDSSAYGMGQIGDAATALGIIAGWVAGGGGDGPEGQLAALFNLATDSSISWRDDSSRILVWFGDAPGHDPIPTDFTFYGFELTEANVTAALVAAGIRVIAISTTTGFYPAGLDDDPTLNALDYQAEVPGYVPGGTAGQATRIAAATGGMAIGGIDESTIVDAIITSLVSLPVNVSMASDASWPLSVMFTPSVVTVPSGTVATFAETISVAADAVGGEYYAKDWVLIDGEPLRGPDGEIIYEYKTIKVPEGFVTGGGQITKDIGTGKKKEQYRISFAGTVGYMADFSVVGQYQMNLHNVSVSELDGARFHSTEITDFNPGADSWGDASPPDANANYARIIAKGRLNNEDGWTLGIVVADRGEPGKNDSILINLWDPDGHMVYNSYWDFGTNAFADAWWTYKLTAGNIQLHSGTK